MSAQRQPFVRIDRPTSELLVELADVRKAIKKEGSGPYLRWKLGEIVQELTFRGECPPECIPKPPVVYFIKCGQFVKIGFSRDAHARIRHLSTALSEPPVLLLTKPGNRDDEDRYHRKFSRLRSHREWFRLDGSLLAFLRAEGCDV